MSRVHFSWPTTYLALACYTFSMTTISDASSIHYNQKSIYDIRQGGTGALLWPTPLPGWSETRGGRGGATIEVTSLAASGPGSLAAALAAAGPRTVVFRIGGTIDLAGATLTVTSPYVTIAGETAPNPGITIIRGGLAIQSHNTIVRHIRIRPGEAGFAKQSGWEVDGITIGRSYDVILDHVSASWATDETLSANGGGFYGPSIDDWRNNQAHRITFYRCIIGEALNNSTHSKGGHSMGTLIGNNAREIALIGNLYISNMYRNPLFTGGSRGVIINNYIYNPGARGINIGLSPDEWENRTWQKIDISVVGNVIRRGPSSRPEMMPLMLGWTSTSSRGGVAEINGYFHDNLYLNEQGVDLSFPAIADTIVNNTEENGTFGFSELSTRVIWPHTYAPLAANSLQSTLLTDVGARPWNRDATDARLVNEATNGGGAIINSETDVEGYPS